MKPIPVLYLTHDGLTDSLGRSQILPYLIRLASHGYAITIISLEKPMRYQTSGHPVKAICDQHGIQWHPLTYHKKPPVAATLWDLWRMRRVARKLMTTHHFNIVHCRSYLTALIGLHLKRRYGIRFIFDMRGFWADERIEGGIWNIRNPFYRWAYQFFKKQERIFLAESDVVISLTENARREIISWGIQTPVLVIPCCVDTHLFDPARVDAAAKQNLRDALQIKANQAVLLYLGSWGTWYRTHDMLEFFARIKRRSPNARFLIVSHDHVEIPENYAYREDIILRAADRAEIPVYISIATASLMLILPSFSKKASSATKMAELLAMNVPVITNTGWGDVDQIIAASCCYPVEGLSSLENLNSQTRDFCLAHFSLELAEQQYLKAYGGKVTSE